MKFPSTFRSTTCALLTSSVISLGLGMQMAFSQPLPPVLARHRSIGTWQGQGRIVEGLGEGGVVQLTLTFDGHRIRTLQGPSLEQPAQTLDDITMRDGGKVWTFQTCGQGLCVSLRQNTPHRLVRYLLFRQ